MFLAQIFILVRFREHVPKCDQNETISISWRMKHLHDNYVILVNRTTGQLVSSPINMIELSFNGYEVIKCIKWLLWLFGKNGTYSSQMAYMCHL